MENVITNEDIENYLHKYDVINNRDNMNRLMPMMMDNMIYNFTNNLKHFFDRDYIPIQPWFVEYKVGL